MDENLEEKEGKRCTLRKIRKTLDKKEECEVFVATSNGSRKERELFIGVLLQ